MITAHSPQARISSHLRSLDCNNEQVVGIVRSLGLRISSGQFSLFMNDKRQLDQGSIDRLLEILQRMDELQNSVAPVPIAWSKSQSVANALMLRLISNAAHDVGSEHEKEFAELANKAAQQAT